MSVIADERALIKLEARAAGQRQREPPMPYLTAILVDGFRTVCRWRDKSIIISMLVTRVEQIETPFRMKRFGKAYSW